METEGTRMARRDDRRAWIPYRLAARKPKNVMAGSTGLEPATSGVTGRRSNQLNYDPAGRRLRGEEKGEGRKEKVESKK